MGGGMEDCECRRCHCWTTRQSQGRSPIFTARFRIDAPAKTLDVKRLEPLTENVTGHVTGHGSLTGHLTGHATGQMR
jgi:hypothetical protein